MLHVMIDIETLGVQPWSVIRSIGAVSFDPRAEKLEFHHTFYSNVTRKSCIDAGLIVESSVEKWWSTQSKEAQAVFDENPRDLGPVLNDLTRWFGLVGANCVWAQGAAFDFPIIQTAYDAALGKKPPWNFRYVRDTRTAYDILGFNTDTVERAGTYHNAIDDCKHQAICLHRAYKR